MSFLTEGMYGYEDEVISQADYIDDYFRATAYENVVLPAKRTAKKPAPSLYGRRMQMTLKLANTLYNDVDLEMKKLDQVIKKHSSRNPKYEMEAYATKTQLYNTKLSVIKTIADMETKIKKSADDDLKLQKELNGVVNPNQDQLFGNTITNSDTYLNGLIAQGANSLQVDYSSMIDSNSLDNAMNSRLEIPSPNPTANVVKPNDQIRPKPVNLSDIQDTPLEVEKPQVYNDSNISGYVTNALGETVPIYNTLEDKFLDGTMASGEYSLKSIEINNNPDIKEVFVYNKDQKMGYLSFYNMKTGNEVKGGTHIPLELLYPFDIDLKNSVVSTGMEEEYSLVLTDKPVPKEIADKWNNLEAIQAKKEEDKQLLRNNKF